MPTSLFPKYYRRIQIKKSTVFPLPIKTSFLIFVYILLRNEAIFFPNSKTIHRSHPEFPLLPLMAQENPSFVMKCRNQLFKSTFDVEYLSQIVGSYFFRDTLTGNQYYMFLNYLFTTIFPNFIAQFVSKLIKFKV